MVFVFTLTVFTKKGFTSVKDFIQHMLALATSYSSESERMVLPFSKRRVIAVFNIIIINIFYNVSVKFCFGA